MATLHNIILLKRDPSDKQIITQLSVKEALNYMSTHDFCNPHQLVRDKRKLELRTNFFERVFENCRVHLINTIGTPQQTQAEIRKLLRLKEPFDTKYSN